MSRDSVCRVESDFVKKIIAW